MPYSCLSFYYSANPSSVHWYIQTIGWYVMTALVMCGFAYMIWALIRKRVSLLMPAREQMVEVIRIVGTDVKALDGQNYMPSKAKVVVAYRKKNKYKKKTLYANHVGVQEGDQGILQYRGVFCTEFIKEGSYLEDQIDIYYHFGFNKNKAKNVTKKSKRTKRKYW